VNRLILPLAAAGTLTACMSAQSARVLAPGKTQVAAGVTRLTATEADDDVIYLGELRVAHGVSDTTEVAAEVSRTPGVTEAYTSVAFAPKFQLSRTATSAVSLGLPLSLSWAERGISEVEGGTIGVFPTLYAGFDVSKEAELLIIPRFGIAKPMGDDAEGVAYGLGLGVGLRLGDSVTHSAIEPTLGFLQVRSSEGNGDSVTFLMLGLAVTAGD
jgi:hypothetical protein